MAFNGSGVYSLAAGNPVVTGTTISSTWANNTLNDLATGLTNALCKDGQSTPTANIKLGNFKLTGLGAGTLAGDSLRFEQLFSQGNPTDIASATTTDIGAQTTNFLNVTGTTTITGLGTNYNGPKMLKFAGAVLLTYNATTLVLPGAANFTTAAGDTCIAIPKSTASGTPDGWTLVAWQIAANAPGVATTATTASYGSGIVAGVPMTFQQTTAPTGWTKVTTHNDKALRVVSGTASSGGSVAFTTAFTSQGVGGTVGNTTLSTAQMPSHTHPGSYARYGTTGGSSVAMVYEDGGSGVLNIAGAVIAEGGGGSHTHSFTGTAINLAVQYVDLILATKN